MPLGTNGHVLSMSGWAASLTTRSGWLLRILASAWRSGGKLWLKTWNKMLNMKNDLPATSGWVFFFLCWQRPKEEGTALNEILIPERHKLTHRAIRLEWKKSNRKWDAYNVCNVSRWLHCSCIWEHHQRQWPGNERNLCLMREYAHRPTRVQVNELQGHRWGILYGVRRTRR